MKTTQRCPMPLGVVEMLNALPDGVYVTDPDRRILCWNRAAEVITGWTASEVVGRTCFDNVLCHIDQDGHPLCGAEHCPLHRSIVTGHPSDQPQLLFARRRNGERIAVEVSVAPLRDPDGHVMGGIETFRDMSVAMDDLLRAQQIQRQMQDIPLGSDPRLRIERLVEERDAVGGDLICVRRVNGDRYAILVLDVRGHGLAAALYTVFLRSAWDNIASRWNDPACVLDHLNHVAVSIAPDAGYLATALAGLVDAATGQLRIARAGHPAPVIHSRREWRYIGMPHPALGLAADSVYSTSDVQLATDESVLMYTDGAIEALDARGEEIGVEGLLDVLRGTDGCLGVGAGASERLLRRTNAVRPADDISLLLLSRT